MILAQHTVGGISPIVLLEHNVLLVLAALNDLIRASLELCTELADKRDDERRHDREDELGELIFELLDDFGKNRDLLEGSGDTCEAHC
jgi:hypothetical protein